MRTIVDLPAPFGPSSAKTEPVSMARSTSSSTRLPPKFADARGVNCVGHTQTV